MSNIYKEKIEVLTQENQKLNKQIISLKAKVNLLNQSRENKATTKKSNKKTEQATKTTSNKKTTTEKKMTEFQKNREIRKQTVLDGMKNNRKIAEIATDINQSVPTVRKYVSELKKEGVL